MSVTASSTALDGARCFNGNNHTGQNFNSDHVAASATAHEAFV
jgi:hypothetical protein